MRRIAVPLLIGVVLAAAVLAVYRQVGGHRFLVLDDRMYVTANAHVRSGLTWDSVAWAFGSFHEANWHPLTWLSHMLDVDLFGMAPGAHHLVNVLLHVANALLLFAVLFRMTREPWKCAFVAALFALHPLHVESVAWVAERKDVLSAFFWLLAMSAYAGYAASGGVRRYLAVVLLFLAGLLSKPMVVTLPFVFLLLDYWPLGRFGRETARRLVIEKVPLFALSAASCVVTWLAQAGGGALPSTQSYPLGVRAGNAVVSYLAYLEKTVWPSSLAVYYPHPGAGLPAWEIALAAIALAGVTVFAILRGRGQPYLATGWFWYLGTLVPVIGLVQAGEQAMADRYTYLPLVGVSIMIAWGVPRAVPPWRLPRQALGAAGALALAALSQATWHQAGYWRDSVTLLRHAVEVTPDNYVAHHGLGFALHSEGRLEEAIWHYREALRIAPDCEKARNALFIANYQLMQSTGKRAD